MPAPAMPPIDRLLRTRAADERKWSPVEHGARIRAALTPARADPTLRAGGRHRHRQIQANARLRADGAATGDPRRCRRPEAAGPGRREDAQQVGVDRRSVDPGRRHRRDRLSREHRGPGRHRRADRRVRHRRPDLPRHARLARHRGQALRAPRPHPPVARSRHGRGREPESPARPRQARSRPQGRGRGQGAGLEGEVLRGSVARPVRASSPTARSSSSRSRRSSRSAPSGSGAAPER